MEEKKIEDYSKDILRITGELINSITLEKKTKETVKEDALYLLNALKVACDIKNIKFINAIIIAFGYMQKDFKNCLFMFKELKDRLVQFYND